VKARIRRGDGHAVAVDVAPSGSGDGVVFTPAVPVVVAAGESFVIEVEGDAAEDAAPWLVQAHDDLNWLYTRGAGRDPALILARRRKVIEDGGGTDG
jgi:hypothetical protein